MTHSHSRSFIYIYIYTRIYVSLYFHHMGCWLAPSVQHVSCVQRPCLLMGCGISILDIILSCNSPAAVSLLHNAMIWLFTWHMAYVIIILMIGPVKSLVLLTNHNSSLNFSLLETHTTNKFSYFSIRLRSGSRTGVWSGREAAKPRNKQPHPPRWLTQREPGPTRTTVPSLRAIHTARA